MNIKGILFSKDAGVFTTSLTDIKKNAKSNLRSDFKEFVKENINESALQSRNIDKLIDKKLNLAENPIYQLTKDVFVRSSASSKNQLVTTNSVLEKFKLNATKFLEEATPQEMKILQEYYTKNLAEGNFIDKWLGSSNKCTDGKDDGKISLLSKVENIVEGSVKTIVGCAKELVSDQNKFAKLCIGSAIMIGLSFTTVGAIAVPVLGLLTGGHLIYKGAKKVIKNAKLASQATTDAEAKDRWENIGNGLTQAGAGIAVTYGSVKEAVNVINNGPKNIINRGQEIAKANQRDMKGKDIIWEIEKDVLKDPTNFVED